MKGWERERESMLFANGCNIEGGKRGKRRKERKKEMERGEIRGN